MSASTVVTEGFGTFGNVNFVVTEGYGDYGGAPAPAPTPAATAATISGVKRRIRVRRADFSSQSAYEFAMRAALADANFFIVPADETSPLPGERKPTPRLPKRIAVDKSLSKDIDREITASAENFARLQRASEMDEIELLHLFINIIEEEY